MNANMSLVMKRTIYSLLVGSCFILLSAADASAHGVEYRPHIAHGSYVHGRTRFFPAWLKRNREFQRWYWHSHYRLERRVSWRRLYDIYRFERRHRWNSRRYYNRVYRDEVYRPYYKIRRKRKH